MKKPIVKWENYRNPAVNGECTLEDFETWSKHPLARGKFRIVEKKTIEDPPEAKEAKAKKKKEGESKSEESN